MTVFTSTSANNAFHGTNALDTVKFSGAASGYRIEYLSNGIVRVVDINPANGNHGSDLLTGIEKLNFSDRSYSVSLTGAPIDFRPLPDSDKGTSAGITGLANGGYVLSWTVRSSSGTDFEVFTRQYDKYGVTVGGSEQVNTTSLYPQYANEVITLADGAYIIAWKSGIDSSGWDGKLLIQKFDTNGIKIGTEILLDTDEAAYAHDISLLDNENYLITWHSQAEVLEEGEPVIKWGIYTQLFDAAGSSVGDTTFTPDFYSLLSIPLADGKFALVEAVGNSQSLRLQHFNADGSVAGAPTTFDAEMPLLDTQYPVATQLNDGSFVVMWNSMTGSTIYECTIYAQRFDANGQTLGSTFQVNTQQVGHASLLSIDTLANGDYVATWSSSYYAGTDGKGNADAIYAQCFDSTGNKIGTEFRVNSTTGDYTGAPTVTALADGGYIVNWSSEDDEWNGARHLFAQRFDADGKAYALATQTITGTSGNDTINAGAGMQSISGLVGNDTLRGGGGNDTLNGGTGSDTLYGEAGNDTYILADQDKVIESSKQGTDTVKAAFTYTLGNNLETLILTGSKAINGSGNTLANKITGNGAANILDGKAGNDTLDGGLGKDTLIGGAGNDTYIIKDADIVKELDGFSFDTVRASISYALGANVEGLELTGNAAINGTGNDLDNGIAGNDSANTVKGGKGRDDVRGGGGNDKVYGGDGTDWLYGEAGNDTVYGDAGDDYIHCGPGSDKLYGGAGKDIFIFSDDITGVNRLMDYSVANDTIHLAIHVVPEVDIRGPLKKGNFAANISGMALDANDHILYETWSGRLYYDADGNGAGAKILLGIIGNTSHPALTYSEFVIT